MKVYADTDYGARDALKDLAEEHVVKTLHSPEPRVWIAKLRFAGEAVDDTAVVYLMGDCADFEVVDRR